MRLARTADLEAVALLNHCILPNDPLGDELSRGVWWLLKEGRKLVGYCGMRTSDHPGNEGLWFLSRVGVLPEYRGRGLQKRMIQARVRYARTRRAELIVTYTAVWNVASSNSLIACGFKLYEPYTKWVGDDVNYWRKLL